MMGSGVGFFWEPISVNSTAFILGSIVIASIIIGGLLYYRKKRRK